MEWSELITDEGEIRKQFESYISNLRAVRYSLDRDEHKEYKQSAVFHMWTGFCIAKDSQEGNKQ